MACEHLTIYNNEPDFLNPSLKSTWICLYDGCTKLKKNITKDELIHAADKLQIEHRVFIHCQTLEIYCTICKIQIYDSRELYLPQPSKTKKQKNIDPYHLRQFLMPQNHKQSNIFAGISEYPPSFQKQKRGLCCLKQQGITSYLKSVVYLFAYIPSIIDISASVNSKKLEIPIVRHLLQAIDTIWSGKYRIHNITQLSDQIAKQTFSQNNTFESYNSKTPHHILYLFIKKIMEQFQYTQLACSSGQIINQPYFEQNIPEARNYNPIKQLFRGNCILEQLCKNCNHREVIQSPFECLKVSYQNSNYHENNYKANLYGLIEEALNPSNSHSRAIYQMSQGLSKCSKCTQILKDYQTFVELPNNLFLEFGDDLDDLNVNLPNEIDITPIVSNISREKSPAVFDYLGCIQKSNRRYITHVKNYFNQKEYLFNEEEIEQQQKPFQSIKIAVYKRRYQTKNQPLYRNLASSLQVNINPIAPLPDFWSIYLKHNHNVQPMVNPFICCHGKLKNNLQKSKMKDGPQRIPIQIYKYYLQIFGGRHIEIEHQNDYCKQCHAMIQIINEIKNSEKQMALWANKFSQKKNWHLISREWLQKWRQFVYENNNKGYRMFGNVRPGPIDNSGFQNFSNYTLKFKQLSPQVWYFLFKFYGGGPRLTHKKSQPNIVVTTSVNLRFQALKQNLKILGIYIQQQPQQKYEQKIEELQEEHSPQKQQVQN